MHAYAVLGRRAPPVVGRAGAHAQARGADRGAERPPRARACVCVCVCVCGGVRTCVLCHSVCPRAHQCQPPVPRRPSLSVSWSATGALRRAARKSTAVFGATSAARLDLRSAATTRAAITIGVGHAQRASGTHTRTCTLSAGVAGGGSRGGGAAKGSRASGRAPGGGGSRKGSRASGRAPGGGGAGAAARTGGRRGGGGSRERAGITPNCTCTQPPAAARTAAAQR